MQEVCQEGKKEVIGRNTAGYESRKVGWSVVIKGFEGKDKDLIEDRKSGRRGKT